MRGLSLPLLLAALASAGCSIPVEHLQFRGGLGQRSADEAARAASRRIAPVGIRWSPPGFVQRVDVQSASGFVGGAARIGVAVGPVLTTRVADYLSLSVGLAPGSEREVAITVIEARTSFAFRPDGRFLDRADCTLKVRVDAAGRGFEETYYSSDTLRGAPYSRAGILDDVLEEIAAMLSRDILRKLAEPPPP